MGSGVKSYGPAQFITGELSWLEFNQRVLDEALDPFESIARAGQVLRITSSNLDEFFEVRVAGLKQQVESDVVERSIDGLTATEALRAVTLRVRRMVEQQYGCWQNELLPRTRHARHPLSRLPPNSARPISPGWSNITVPRSVRC